MLRRLFVMIFVVTIFFLMTGSGYSFTGDDVVAAWTFEEGSGTVIRDASGHGNDGELMGQAEWVNGRFGRALHFDGSSGYIEVPFAENLRLLNQGDFTLAAWFMADEIPPENKNVFQQGDANGTGRTWLFVHNSNEIRTFVGGAATASGIGVEAGVWYHVAVVVTEGGDTDTIQLYVNGEAAGAPGERGMEDSEGVFFIATHKNMSGFWDGIIDDVVLINKALDAAEIAVLTDNGITATAVKPAGKLAVRWGEIKVR